VCHQCGKSFGHRQNLRQHLLKAHKDSPAAACTVAAPLPLWMEKPSPQ
jgi:hypothetical protein